MAAQAARQVISGPPVSPVGRAHSSGSRARPAAPQAVVGRATGGQVGANAGEKARRATLDHDTSAPHLGSAFSVLGPELERKLTPEGIIGSSGRREESSFLSRRAARLAHINNWPTKDGDEEVRRSGLDSASELAGQSGRRFICTAGSKGSA